MSTQVGPASWPVVVGQVANLRTECHSVQPGAARPVGQSPWTARDPLVALLLTTMQPPIGAAPPSDTIPII